MWRVPLRRNLFLFLLLLVFAGRASADEIAANCSPYYETPILTNGQFQAVVCSQLPVAGQTVLYQSVVLIDGPNGLETLDLGSSVAVQINQFYQFFLNDQGDVAVSYSSIGTFVAFVAAYTGSGVQQPNISFALPGSTIQTNFAYLQIDPGPVFYDYPDAPSLPDVPEDPLPDTEFRSIVFTGITDSGVVEGDAQYEYYVHPVVSIPVTWNIGAVPEPATLMLLIPGLLALAAFRLKTLVLR
jgi:hypothetical protein